MSAHLSFLEKNAARIRAAGPLRASSGEPAGGLWVVEADSCDEVDALVKDEIQAVAPSLGVEVRPINLQNAAEIERDLESFARDAGLIVASSTTALVNRNLIIALAMRHKLPAVYAVIRSAKMC
jgi:uncharacterized protein YciI